MYLTLKCDYDIQTILNKVWQNNIAVLAETTLFKIIFTDLVEPHLTSIACFYADFHADVCHSSS